ncbi:MAG: IMP dehydrogenase, partial [Candidatus Aenigmarchaeota archaeon]|nr:IMP dehydrogenase [Candidatus Aenigmarchaeota archaeon]
MSREIVDSYSRTLQEYILLTGLIPDDVSSDDIDLSTDMLTKGKVRLNIPVLTAAMQSVTGPRMAIAIAKLGGSGVIYCSQPVADEVRMIGEVKKYKAGFVVPEVLSPRDTIYHVIQRMSETGYSKFPVTDDGKSDGRLLGLLTDNDFDPQVHADYSVQERMRRVQELDVVDENEINDDIRMANRKLREGHHSVLPIIDRDGRLKALVFRRDMLEHEANPYELLDEEKRYIVGAAINTHDFSERAPAVVDAGADYLVIDTSQGHSP